MKTGRLYLILVILNFLPVIGLFLFSCIEAGIDNMYGDHNIILFCYIAFFFISTILNLSLFCLKKETVKNNKLKYFLSSYLSSLFFLILSTYILQYWISMKISYGFTTIDYFIEPIIDSLWFYVYFFVNFLPILIYRIRTKKHNNSNECIKCN